MKLTAVGFEPTQLALVELESTPLRPLGQTVVAAFPETSFSNCKAKDAANVFDHDLNHHDGSLRPDNIMF